MMTGTSETRQTTPEERSAEARPSVVSSIATARVAQGGWAAMPITERLALIRRFRRLIADRADRLAASITAPWRGDPTETLAAEIIPLADACRYLERQAPRLLRPRKLGRRGRPAWLTGVRTEIRRDPLGVVLVIGPSNYPLMLPGIQAVQALTAGNAVIIKPGRMGRPAALAIADLLQEAGLPRRVIHVLDESVEAARTAIDAGVDKIVFTGSVGGGRRVMHQAGETLTPMVAELSGCDAMFVLDDADLDLVARAIRFGVTFNAAATCIAPRRVFVTRQRVRQLEHHLIHHLQEVNVPAERIEPNGMQLARETGAAAVDAGASMIVGDLHADPPRFPLLLTDVAADTAIARSDVFAPVVSLIPVEDMEAALLADRECPYALGASVFGPAGEAAALARRVDAGAVTVNDLIAPTADPRAPFGGRHQSGFGLTRGAEGLLEFTAVQCVFDNRAPMRPHLDEPRGERQTDLLRGYLDFAHGAGLRHRARAAGRMLRAVWRQARRD